MDIKRGIDHKHAYFTRYNFGGSIKYKYDEEGVLKRCLPRILFKGNTIFTTFLQLIDMRIIMTLKYIQRLQQFKFISRY